jgi:hypothetical protein
MPNRERDCEPYRMPDQILQVAHALGKLDGWAVKGGKHGLVIPWHGQKNVAGLWGLLAILSLALCLHVSRC